MLRVFVVEISSLHLVEHRGESLQNQRKVCLISWPGKLWCQPKPTKALPRSRPIILVGSVVLAQEFEVLCAFEVFVSARISQPPRSVDLKKRCYEAPQGITGEREPRDPRKRGPPRFWNNAPWPSREVAANRGARRLGVENVHQC